MHLSSLARRRKSQGQSVVEFALVIPILLLLTLTAIDFGRVFLGWVNVQQMTRIAANDAAEHISAWVVPGDADGVKARYQARVQNDARQINCDPQDPIPAPMVTGTQLGAPVTVALTCEFHIITPIISNIIGGTILVSAETTYPVKEGIVATVPGGGAPILPAPEAKFLASPRSGWGDLVVEFANTSTGGSSSQVWNFVVAPGGTGSGSAIPNTSTTAGPQSVTYRCVGTFPDTCTFSVSLAVSSSGGSDTETKPADYITVSVPPVAGPMADFTATPRTGVEPQLVAFTFDDPRTPDPVTYTTYEWDLDGNGSFEASGVSPSKNYPDEGEYDITLRVTDSTGAQSTMTKKGYIVIAHKICTVPDFGNVNVNQAQNRWQAAGFTTQVLFEPGRYNKITSQSITGGIIDPQPDGCASVITVGP